jgi:hypothetical protein
MNLTRKRRWVVPPEEATADVEADLKESEMPPITNPRMATARTRVHSFVRITFSFSLV